MMNTANVTTSTAQESESAAEEYGTTDRETDVKGYKHTHNAHKTGKVLIHSGSWGEQE